MNQNIKTSSDTIMSMCLEYQMGGITEETFVSNLERFARYCGKECATNSMEAKPEQPTTPKGVN